MTRGTVKWFNNQKGYGFICPTEGENEKEEIFAHFSSIVMDGYKRLSAGQKVTFEINNGSKGLHAINIKLVEAENLWKVVLDILKLKYWVVK